MIDGIIALIFLIVGLNTKNDTYFIVSALFSISGNIASANRKKIRS